MCTIYCHQGPLNLHQHALHRVPLSADLGIGASPAQLRGESTFPIFLIVHQYNMQLLLRWCWEAVEDSPPDLWPSAPIASSDVPKHPRLIQLLALAESKQCAPLVRACLTRLLKQEDNDAIHGALTSPHLRKLMDGLLSETKTDIMFKMATLLLGYDVRDKPECVMRAWKCDGRLIDVSQPPLPFWSIGPDPRD